LGELDQLADGVPIGSRGVVALPHFDGMISPAPDITTRGAFLGLSLHHTRADMYRAILESLGFSLRENLEFLRHNGFRTEVVRAIGGGAKSDYLMQMNADISGWPIERPPVTEAAVVGAAMIAAVGAGAFATLEECSEAFYKKERVFTPDPSKHALYEELYHRYIEFYQYVYRHPLTPPAS
jgi:xylulokinase